MRLFLLIAIACLVKGIFAQTVLTPGTVIQDFVAQAGENEYTFATGGQTETLTVILTPLDAGEPELHAGVTGGTNHEARSDDFYVITIDHAEYTGKAGYVKVFGTRNSNYALFISFESTVEMLNGIPVSGRLSQGSDAFYTVTIDPNADDIMLSATPLIGDPTVCVGAAPGSCTWQSEFGGASQGEALVIYRADNPDDWPTNGQFYVKLTALLDTDYSLAITESKTHMHLRDGIPQREHVETHDWEYFAITVSNPKCSLSIAITPISAGDPDLYVSTNNPFPSSTNFTRRSRRYGADDVTFDDARVGKYYVGVYAWQATTFSILSDIRCSENSTVQFVRLIDGSPQTSVLERKDIQLYKIYVDNHHNDLTITVSRKYGDPDLYVRANNEVPTIHWYQWSSVHSGEDLLTIRQGQDGWCHGCYYIIAVYAYTATEFTIQAQTSGAIATLQAGVAMREDLRAGEYEYFQIPVDASFQEFTVTVTDLGRGDPDLFISTTKQFPNITSHQWSAQRLHGDSITIPHTDPHHCQFPCTYYISVLAFSHTTFTIVATFDNPTHLVDGIPQVGQVNRGAMKYYRFNVDAEHQEVDITLTGFSGTTTLLVSTTELPQINRWNSYQWRASWWSGSVKTIAIPETDENACKNTTCTYQIGVYGSQNSTYAIVAASKFSTIPLQNGVPMTEDVATGEWEYFSIRIDSKDTNLAVICTPMTGDPDLYVQLDKFPNRTSYMKMANRWGADSVYFENATIGTYYIGVNAFQATSFTITAVVSSNKHNDTQNVLTLIDGNPQEGLLARGQYQYYKLDLSADHDDVVFTLTKLFGDPDLYVSDKDTLPIVEDPSTWTYSSTHTAADLISIKHPARKIWYVAVYAYTACSYSVVGTTMDVVTTLQDGRTLRGDVEQGEMEYYRLWIDKPQDFSVVLTPFSGDADLFVDNRPDRLPNRTSYRWRSQAYRGDSVTVTSDSENPPYCYECYYTIGVYGFTGSAFSITATFQNTSTLEDGYPINGQVADGQFKYYRIEILDGHTDTTFTLTPSDGSCSLYIHNASLPNKHRYMWHKTNFFGTTTLTIRDSDAGHSNIYYIGVYGVTDSSYSLVVTTSHEEVVLQDGIPVQEWVDAGDWEYFQYDVRNSGDSIVITCTPLTGDPDVYVSFGENITDWRWSQVWNSAIVIRDTEVGVYHIGVYGYGDQPATFTLVASNLNETRQTTLLVNGQPQNGLLPHYGERFYHFILNEQHDELTFSLTRTYGDPDIFIRMDHEPAKTRDDYNWSQTSWGNELVTIPDPPLGEYYIMIYAYSRCDFHLVATTSDNLLQLIDGVPFREDLTAKSYEYFQITVDRLDKDLSITVTSFHGDPDLFLSTHVPFPSIEHHDRSSRRWMEDSITIRASDLNMTTYYVSVYAYTECTFTILASFNDHVQLQDGIPQASQVAVNEQKEFYMRVTDAHSDITITATPFNGAVYLYISKTEFPVRGDPSTYQWSETSYWSQTQTHTIYATDPDACHRDCTYYIMVWGLRSSTFSVTASTSLATNQLMEGVPMQEVVGAGNWSYFSFELLNKHADLTISATPFSGDPDLYISTTQQHPDTTAEWSETQYGADAWHIAYTDDGYKVGTYYIGVYAWSASTFTILATVTDVSNTTGDTLLIDGSPQVGLLDHRNDVRYYKFPVGAGHYDVTFSVNPRYGDPDMYITDVEGEYPSRQAYKWAAYSYGRDQITVSNGCTSCTYTIAVIAYQHTLYSISAATSDAIIILEDGVQHTDTVSRGDEEYFRLTVEDGEATSLTIVVTALTGDPDIYVSRTHQKPNATNHPEWSRTRYGSDTLTIPNPEAGVYYIGIMGYFSSTFTIVASIGATTLTDSTPMAGSLSANHHHNYVYHMRTGDVTFELQPTSGILQMYVANWNNGTNPTESHYQWSTVDGQVGVRNEIHISTNATGSCYDCTYHIRVVAQTSSTFIITARSESKSVQLASGHPTSGHVAAGAINYYRAIMDHVVADHKDINIAVTTFVGDVNIFVTSCARVDGTLVPDCELYPVNETAQWRTHSDNSPHGDHITISWQNDDYVAPGEYYIGVYGESDSDYTITMTTEDVLLVDGSASVAQLSDEGSFFFFNLELGETDEKVDITISLTGFGTSGSGQNVFHVYVSTNTTQPAGASDNVVWDRVLNRHDSFVISKDDEHYAKTMTLYIGVLPYASANEQFSISASTMTSSQQMLDKVESRFSFAVASQDYQYFHIYVPRADNFTIYVEACSGDVSLFVSDSIERPDVSHSDVSLTTQGTIRIFQSRLATKTDTTFYFSTLPTISGSLSSIASSYAITAFVSDVPTQMIDILDKTLETVTAETATIEIKFKSGSIASLGNSIRLTYTAYYAIDDPALVMYTSCGLEKATQGPSIVAANTPDQELSLSLTGLSVGSPYALNIEITYMQRVGLQNITHRLAYSPAAGVTPINSGGNSHNSDDGGVNKKLLFAIGIPVAILVVALVCYLLNKNRKLTKELEIEMHDVPKAAVRKAVRDPAERERKNRPNKKDKNYSRLLAEEENDLDDDYLPPDFDQTI